MKKPGMPGFLLQCRGLGLFGQIMIRQPPGGVARLLRQTSCIAIEKQLESNDVADGCGQPQNRQENSPSRVIHIELYGAAWVKIAPVNAC